MISADYTREADHAAIDAQVATFLARGGQIEVIPRGVSGEGNLTPRQRINPTVMTKADREAKKARDATIPSTRAKSDVAPRPRVRKPREPKARTRNGPMPARPGTKQREALDALRKAGPITAKAFASTMGWGHNLTVRRLTVLRETGLATSEGTRASMRWRAACP